MSIIFGIVHGGKFISGYSQGFDTSVISSLGIQHITCNAPIILPALWFLPWFPWIKLHTDGLSKENLGLAACGGVFMDCYSQFLRGFYQWIGHRNSFFAVLLAIAIVAEFDISEVDIVSSWKMTFLVLFLLSNRLILILLALFVHNGLFV